MNMGKKRARSIESSLHLAKRRGIHRTDSSSFTEDEVSLSDVSGDYQQELQSQRLVEELRELEGELGQIKDQLKRTEKDLRNKRAKLETTRNTYESAKGTPNENTAGKELVDTKLVVAEAKRDVADAKLDVAKTKQEIASIKCDLAEGAAGKQEAKERFEESKRDVAKAERDVAKAERDVAKAERDVAAEVLSIAEATGVAASPLDRAKQKYNDCVMVLRGCETALTTAQKALDRIEQDMSANSPQKGSDGDSRRRQEDAVLRTYSCPGLGNAVMNHVDDSGVIKTGVLDLTEFQFPGKFKMPATPIYVSEHMRNLWRLLNECFLKEKPEKQQEAVISGSPGVGKTLFMFLYLVAFVKKTEKICRYCRVFPRKGQKPVVTWYRVEGDSIMKIENLRTDLQGNVFVKDLTLFLDGYRRDMMKELPIEHALCVSTSGQFTADGAHLGGDAPEVFYFPAWELDEVKLLFSEIRLSRPKQDFFANMLPQDNDRSKISIDRYIKKKYKVTGGSLRSLLGMKYEKCVSDANDILDSLSGSQVNDVLSGKSNARQVDSLLRTYLEEDNYRKRTRKIDNLYFCKELVLRADFTQWKAFVKVGKGALAGLLFEDSFLSLARRQGGNEFKLRARKYFDGGSSSYREFVVKTTGSSRYVSEAEFRTMENRVLWIPQKTNYGVIDCAINNRGNETKKDDFIYIQLTVSNSHSFNADKMRDVADRLGGAKSSGKYYAVVNCKDTADGFRLKDNGRGISTSPTRVELWVAYWEMH